VPIFRRNQIHSEEVGAYVPTSSIPPKSSEETPDKKKKSDIHAHPEKLLEELRSVSDEG
jgi:hypothetical protein